MIKSFEGQFEINSKYKDCDGFDKSVAAVLANGIAKKIVEEFSKHIEITESNGKLNYKLSLYASSKSDLLNNQ